MSQERSSCSLTAFASAGAQKLGQPVPESNFVSDANSGAPQHTHLNMPSRFSRLSACENAGSVPCWRVTRYLLGREQLSPLLVGLDAFSGASRMHGPASRCGESGRCRGII